MHSAGAHGVKWEAHLSAWSGQELKKLGYKVRGSGVHYRLRKALFIPLLIMLSWRFPIFAAGLWAWKRLKT